MIKKRLKRSRLKILYGLLTAITLLGLMAAFVMSWFWNIQKLESQFVAQSHVISQYVREKMAQNETLLVGLSTYFKGKKQVDPQAVRNYATIMSQRFPHIYMFQAAKFVRSGNWDRFAELMQKQNSEASLLRFIGGEGVIQQGINDGDHALPVIMIEPTVEASRLGLDLRTIDFINNHIPQEISERIVLTEPFQMLDEDKVMVMMQTVVSDQSPQFLSLLVVKVNDLLPPAMAGLNAMDVSLNVQSVDEKFQLVRTEFRAEEKSKWSIFPIFEVVKPVDFIDYRLELTFKRRTGWQEIEWGWLVLLTIAFVLLPTLYRLMFVLHSRHEADEELQREVLYRQANYDSLSGLPNRFHFEEYAQRLLSTAQRSHTDMALFYIDLNGFKAVNDNLGHEAGDAILSRVGNSLSSMLRRGDMAARIGGDEFVVIVDPVADMDRLLLILEKLRNLILAANSEDFSPYHVSASLGFAYTRVHGYELQDLMRIADSAMYEEKKAHHRQKNHASNDGKPALFGVK